MVFFWLTHFFSQHIFHVKMEAFSRKRKLGSGGHASVYESVDDAGTPFALKVICRDDPHTFQELSALRVLRDHPHKNITNAVASHKVGTDGFVYQPLELCDMDLMTLVEERGLVKEDDAKVIFSQVLDGLEHCHTHGVFHYDIKPENILIQNKVFTCKLADFGSSHSPVPFEDSPSASSTPLPGTLLYACPESFFSYPSNNEKVDIWALGVTIFTVIQGVYPWEEANEDDEVFYNWMLCDADDEWKHLSVDFIKSCLCVTPISDDLCDLLSCMLHPDVLKRATLAQVRAHPWFKC